MTVNLATASQRSAPNEVIFVGTLVDNNIPDDLKFWFFGAVSTDEPTKSGNPYIKLHANASDIGYYLLSNGSNGSVLSTECPCPAFAIPMCSESSTPALVYAEEAFELLGKQFKRPFLKKNPDFTPAPESKRPLEDGFGIVLTRGPLCCS